MTNDAYETEVLRMTSVISLKLFKNFASADGGPRSRVCAPLTLRSAPHQHKQDFFGARV